MVLTLYKRIYWMKINEKISGSNIVQASLLNENRWKNSGSNIVQANLLTENRWKN